MLINATLCTLSWNSIFLLEIINIFHSLLLCSKNNSSRWKYKVLSTQKPVDCCTRRLNQAWMTIYFVNVYCFINLPENTGQYSCGSSVWQGQPIVHLGHTSVPKAFNSDSWSLCCASLFESATAGSLWLPRGDQEPRMTIISGRMLAFHHPDNELAPAEMAHFIFWDYTVWGRFALFIQVTVWSRLLPSIHIPAVIV